MGMGKTDIDGNEGVITWDEFERIFWKSNSVNQCDPDTTTCGPTKYGLFEQLSYDSAKSESAAGTILFPSRRCYNEDYSLLWREYEDPTTGDKYELSNANPPFCNEDDYDTKPRTFKYGNTDEADFAPKGERSLFPMGTRTRVEALAASNSAYFISI